VSSFGPFELLGKVGEGGMAEVFKARAFGASGFEKIIALKLLREEFVGEPSYERMFAEEARLQALLTHRCLVHAHDSGIVAGRPWVRLDFVDGADVRTLISTARLPTDLACFIVAELCLALNAVHSETQLGLVHRDVSSGNVLLSRSGEVRLGDFGIAKATLMKEQTRGGVRKGSVEYMSPEQAAGRTLTPASDVFSLATLAVELLTGTRPFDGATPVETLEKIREAKPALDGVPDQLREALSKCFVLDPASRPPPRALRDTFHAHAADEPSLAQWVLTRLEGAAG
jgi:serine/threonine protein kinase